MPKNSSGFVVNTNDSNTRYPNKLKLGEGAKRRNVLPDVLVVNRRGHTTYDKILVTKQTGQIEVDVQKFQKVVITLIGNVDVVFINYPPVGEALVVGITVIQNSTGGHSITFPSNTAWEESTVPQFGQTANYRTDFTFEFVRLHNETMITGYIISVNVGVP